MYFVISMVWWVGLWVCVWGLWGLGFNFFRVDSFLVAFSLFDD